MITLNSTDGSMLKLMTTSTEHSVSIKLMVSMDQQTVDSTWDLMMLTQTSLTTSTITVLDGSIFSTTLMVLTPMVNMTN